MKHTVLNIEKQKCKICHQQINLHTNKRNKALDVFLGGSEEVVKWCGRSCDSLKRISRHITNTNISRLQQKSPNHHKYLRQRVCGTAEKHAALWRKAPEMQHQTKTGWTRTFSGVPVLRFLFKHQLFCPADKLVPKKVGKSSGGLKYFRFYLVRCCFLTRKH